MLMVCWSAMSLSLFAAPVDNLMPRPKSVKVTDETAFWIFQPKEVKVVECASDARSVPGAYRLSITPEGATITAADAEGVRYGRTTLRQLMALTALEQSPKTKGVRLPCVEIEDYPTFRMRGLMFDTGRNWLPVSMIEAQLKLLAAYKFNVFQWHITDNHGWRLESKRYPELSRAENLDRTDNFYTQQQFVGLIREAKALGITVIPELDVPGHTMTFRRAFGLKRMDEPKVREIVSNLFDELMDLLDPAVTPYIHIGSDEVKGHERVPDEWLVGWVKQIEARGFKVIAWGPGQYPKGLEKPLTRQYWMGRHVKRATNEPYIDSQSSYYINHVDALELLTQASFQQPCVTGPEENRLGAIFAVWHDDALGKPEDLFTMNPVAPATILFSDNFWNGRPKDEMKWYGNLPPPDHADFAFAQAQERLALVHKELVKKMFASPDMAKVTYYPFYKQTDMRWRMAETEDEMPFNDFPWGERVIAQGTIYAQHFFFNQTNLTQKKSGTVWFGMIVNSDRTQEVDLIADFMNFSRSDNRIRDAALVQGKWNAKGAELYINGKTVPPPHWKQPGTGPNIGEKPLVDEPWTVRRPQRVVLKMGRNEVLVKLPLKGWKRSFTCFFPDAKGLTYEAPACK